MVKTYVRTYVVRILGKRKREKRYSLLEASSSLARANRRTERHAACMQRVRLWFSCSVCDYDLETSQRASELSVTTTTTGDVHVRTRPVEGSGSACVRACVGRRGGTTPVTYSATGRRALASCSQLVRARLSQVPGSTRADTASTQQRLHCREE